MSIPEDQLWSFLDDWGLPFRLSCQELMDRFGSEPDRCFEGYHLCRVPCTSPLSSLLAEPWQFHVGPSTIRSQTPGAWIGYIRQYDDALANLKMVYDRLRPIFGEPLDTSCSNTKEWVWQFGHAQVSAVVFPPEANSHWGHNRRHDLIPGSKTECSIRISDCFREAMPEHPEAIEASQRLAGLLQIPLSVTEDYDC